MNWDFLKYRIYSLIILSTVIVILSPSAFAQDEVISENQVGNSKDEVISENQVGNSKDEVISENQVGNSKDEVISENQVGNSKDEVISENQVGNSKEMEELISIIKEENAATNIQTWLAAISVIVAVSLSIFGITYPQRKQRKELLKNSIKAINLELEDALLGFENPITKRNIEFKGEKINYFLTYFDTSSYDSIVSSGYFIHLERDLQTELTATYSRIKKNNQLLDHVAEIRDFFDILNTDNPRDKTNLIRAKNRNLAALGQIQNEIKNHSKDFLKLIKSSEYEHYMSK